VPCAALTRWPFSARGRRGSSKAAGATAEAWAAASGWAAGRGRGHRADGVGCRGEPLSTYAAPCVGRSARGGAEDRARQRGQRPKRAQQPGGGQRAEEGVQLRAPCCRRTCKVADAERERGVVTVVKTVERACARNVGGVVEGCGCAAKGALLEFVHGVCGRMRVKHLCALTLVVWSRRAAW
jgi:hypothetical protein